MDITQASAEHQVCKAQFDTARAKLSEQESLVTNLEATIEQTKGELESLDRDWQKLNPVCAGRKNGSLREIIHSGGCGARKS
ncbi:hypothetical protein QT322_20595 [Escherichia coli]|nr:hypothetical protein [Escherichia coli]